MTVSIQSIAGASSSNVSVWSHIDWQKAQTEVRRLKMRIAKAVRDRKWGKVKSLQWMLTHSHHTKLLAVKRVSQSSGAKTPGVDGVLWRTAEQKICAALSLQRRGYKAQPKLSRKSIKTFLDDIHALIKSHPTIKTESLFRLLNPKLRG